jgi:hypothetical protein
MHSGYEDNTCRSFRNDGGGGGGEGVIDGRRIVSPARPAMHAWRATVASIFKKNLSQRMGVVQKSKVKLVSSSSAGQNKLHLKKNMSTKNVWDPTNNCLSLCRLVFLSQKYLESLLFALSPHLSPYLFLWKLPCPSR